MMYEAMFKIVQDTAVRHQQSGAYITPEDTVCVICSASQKVYTGISRVEMRGGQPMNVHAEIVAMQQMQAAGETAAESLLMVNLLTRRPMLPCNGCIQYIISQNQENSKCQVVLPDRSMPLSDVGKPAANPYPASMSYGASFYGGQGSMPYSGVVPNPGVYGAQPSIKYASMPLPGQSMNAAQGSAYGSGSVPYSGAVPAGSVYTQSSQMSQPYAGAAPAQGRYMGASLPSGNLKAKNSNADYLKNRVGNLMQAGDEEDDTDEQDEKGLFGRLFNKK